MPPKNQKKKTGAALKPAEANSEATAQVSPAKRRTVKELAAALAGEGISPGGKVSKAASKTAAASPPAKRAASPTKKTAAPKNVAPDSATKKTAGYRNDAAAPEKETTFTRSVIASKKAVSAASVDEVAAALSGKPLPAPKSAQVKAKTAAANKGPAKNFAAAVKRSPVAKAPSATKKPGEAPKQSSAAAAKAPVTKQVPATKPATKRKSDAAAPASKRAKSAPSRTKAAKEADEEQKQIRAAIVELEAQTDCEYVLLTPLVRCPGGPRAMVLSGNHLFLPKDVSAMAKTYVNMMVDMEATCQYGDTYKGSLLIDDGICPAVERSIELLKSDPREALGEMAAVLMFVVADASMFNDNESWCHEKEFKRFIKETGQAFTELMRTPDAELGFDKTGHAKRAFIRQVRRFEEEVDSILGDYRYKCSLMIKYPAGA